MPESVDIFPPPAIAIEVCCLHCRRIYMSDLMVAVEIDRERHWMCPVPDCGALGFMMDIFPTADDYAADECEGENGNVVSDFTDDDAEDDEYIDPLLDHDLPYQPDHFEPAREWTPQSDADDADEDNPFSEDEESDADDYAFPAAEYFTREDFEAARAQGIYERAIAETRAQWKAIHDDGNLPFNDGDIPF
ncbi:MAG: hypothetical protein H7144_03940 [Burkholderiales bacterium]|nr:hypothetical protein [Phycisphaerae bacterium]